MVKPLAGEKAEQLRTSGKLSKTERNRRDQFLAEAIVTGDLDHPHIVPLHDLAVAGDNALFYAMKKVQGRGSRVQGLLLSLNPTKKKVSYC